MRSQRSTVLQGLGGTVLDRTVRQGGRCRVRQAPSGKFAIAGCASRCTAQGICISHDSAQNIAGQRTGLSRWPWLMMCSNVRLVRTWGGATMPLFAGGIGARSAARAPSSPRCPIALATASLTGPADYAADCRPDGSDGRGLVWTARQTRNPRVYRSRLQGHPASQRPGRSHRRGRRLPQRPRRAHAGVQLHIPVVVSHR